MFHKEQNKSNDLNDPALESRNSEERASDKGILHHSCIQVVSEHPVLQA